MHRIGQHESARHVRGQDFSDTRPRASFCKNALTVVSYVTASAIIALLLTYWPASASNVLTKFNVTSASDVQNRIHKTGRLSGISFEERWNPVPAAASAVRSDKIRREPPRADGRIEKIPFSCELAFSRLVREGNFSTRCIASVDSPKTAT